MPEKQDNDPFIAQFFSRIPAEVAETFTPAQLDAVKRAFGARSRGAHSIDLRLSIPLIIRRVYLVILAGSERRESDRRAVDRLLAPVWTLANGFLMLFFGVVLLLSLAGVLYALKMALGIDVFPGVDMLDDDAIKQWLN